MKRPLQRGFTLIELLVVLLIISIVMTMTVPQLNSSLRGMQLNQSAELITSEIRLARQMALTKNHTIDVRFYQYADPESGVATQYFQALQSFDLADDGTAKPIGKMHKLPSSIMIDSSTQLSTLLDASLVKTWSAGDPKLSLPGIDTNYNAYAFQFRPDGSANLSVDGKQWFLTLHYRIDGDNLQSLPHNFAIIQIDPWNGQGRVFRP